MSMTNRWRLALASLAAILIGGAVLAALLALGLADPPRAGPMQWSAAAPQGWPEQSLTPDLTLAEAPQPLPRSFTLELTARNDGPAGSAWGIHLGDAEHSMTILIDNQGYYSLQPFQPQWIEFPHIRPDQANKLYLHVSTNGDAALRINDEIVGAGIVLSGPVNNWGIVRYRGPQLAWHGIALYYQ